MKRYLVATLVLGIILSSAYGDDSNLARTKTPDGIRAIKITGSDAAVIESSITPEKLSDGARKPVRTAYDKEGNVLLQCSGAGASSSCLLMIND